MEGGSLSKLGSSSTGEVDSRRVSASLLVKGLAKHQSDWSNFLNAIVEHTTFGFGVINSIQLRPECLTDGPLIVITFDGHDEKLFNQRSFLSANFTYIHCKSDYISLLEMNIRHNAQIELADAQRAKEIESRYRMAQARPPRTPTLQGSPSLTSKSRWMNSNSLGTGLETEKYSYHKATKTPQYENNNMPTIGDGIYPYYNQGYLSPNKKNAILDMHDEYSSYAAEMTYDDNSHFSPDYDINESSERNKIRATAKNLGIVSIIHFSRAENLESILEHGLINRKNLDDRGFKYKHQDEHRWEGRMDAICLSLSFPNWQLFYKARNKFNDMNNWIVLELNPDILQTHRLAFTRSNAAKGTQKTDLHKHADFLTLFKDEPNKPSRQEMDLPKSYTTDPQAEMLCFQSIEPQFIKSIHFHNPLVAEKNNYKQLSDRFRSVKFQINQFYFSKRSDSNYWAP